MELFGKKETTPSGDELESFNQQYAAQMVDRKGQEFIDDVSPWVIMERGLHLGVNANGERLTAREREVLQSELNEYKQQLADRLTNGDVGNLEDLMARRGLGNKYIKRDILQRLGLK